MTEAALTIEEAAQALRFADCPEIREHIEGLEGECWYLAGRLK